MTSAAQPSLSVIVDRVLPCFPGPTSAATARPFGSGLINQTFVVEDGAARFVLQWVNPIFPRCIHDNIEAVTEHLAKTGLLTPRLIRTRDGQLCLDLESDGVWRLMTHIEGVTFDVIASSVQAHAGGVLVGRFHRALDSFERTFVGTRLGVHDTPAHLRRLKDALAEHPRHRLQAEVAPLAAAILAGAECMPTLPRLADRACHGDLKFNNLLFAGQNGRHAETPVCLVDLDTVGPMPLAFEVGDAWRSWCNRRGENHPQAELDLEVFRASLDGYRLGIDRTLTHEERMALLVGVEWISLELAARFAADALYESYFGWDPAGFPGRGEHNLVRAAGQWSLHQALLETRSERARLLEVPTPGV